MKTNVCVVILGLILLSCSNNSNPLPDEPLVNSNELSKEDAFKILVQDYRGEQCSGNIWRKGSVHEKDYEKNFNHLSDLESQGLINMKYKNFGETNESVSFIMTGSGAERYNNNNFTIALTEERPFEIVGLSPIDERTTSVVFTVIVEATPFYVLATEYGQSKCPLGGKNERDATFIKYDTGWKLKNE